MACLGRRSCSGCCFWDSDWGPRVSQRETKLAGQRSRCTILLWLQTARCVSNTDRACATTQICSGANSVSGPGALPSENLPVGILWLKHVVSVKSSDRAKVHVGVGAIDDSFNQDMRVSKPLCSRCALNVSFWGILWHSMSNPDARNLLIGKVS